VTKGADLLKIEFFDAVARLEAGLAQFSNALDQRGYVIGHRWLHPFILDSWRKQKLVDPRGLDMHVHNDPLLLGTLPASLEGSLDFITTFASQGKANPAEDCFGVSGSRVVVSEKAGIQRDSEPALTQHYKATKCRNNVGDEMN
jgi:hypothetical protein